MENTVSHAMYILEEPVQYMCLTFMALMYAIKIYADDEEAVSAGKGGTQRVIASQERCTLLTNVLRPWDMESTQQAPLFLCRVYGLSHSGRIDHRIDILHSLGSPAHDPHGF